TSIYTLDVDDSGSPPVTDNPLLDRVINATFETGLPVIKQSVGDEADAVAMCIPVYRCGQIISVVIMVGSPSGGDDSSRVGVMEIWQPIGPYDELSLTQGYFGGLDRFQNVSSFVRFEKGSGLPGQVWRNLSFVVHDNLPSHPGFLRAAGASAESLQVAVGMPIFGDHFLASALLISSDAAPIARGYEVWRCADDHFKLESHAYQRPEKTLVFEGDATVPIQGTLPGLALDRGVACISEDPEIVYSGRPFPDGKECRGVAIPFYEEERVTNILTLLL
ncbi:MAG: hypothetical protein KDB00_19280, partial [Planctomycetales bacterium]|nr:hypothetical protein [Planctomycetales bacterium]